MKKSDAEITVIGGGLAGCEAAWRAARMGVRVKLFEMKPDRFSPAHKNESLAELVCSNSLRAESLENASGILKRELELLDSIVIESAHNHRIPAGGALAVDREAFSREITERVAAHPLIDVIRTEVTDLDFSLPAVVATGPLTSDDFSMALQRITGREKLFFYDAISPIIYTDSINMDVAFRASRYGKGGDDYINLPMNKEQYYRLVREIKRADEVEPHSFEDTKIFEGCLPVEVMVRRGEDTLAFGPLKPVGLDDPETGEIHYAVLQLRQENREGTLHNMVGFQTRLKRGEQERVFRMIPGMENARFARYGSVHRNTYIDAPRLLLPTLELKKRSGLFVAGQLVGVEGYVESAAMGIVAGYNAAMLAADEGPQVPPRDSALGSLIYYITDSGIIDFQPMNINFGIMPSAPRGVKKRDRKRYLAKRAISAMETWTDRIGMPGGSAALDDEQRSFSDDVR
ncbi:MAG: methylenetetrahydrofolate--tRNA-(uracil(54)-C(5))-methyltransferase (FADH(2)-oxidizing) TrmFO [Deltaproteobacteria bacterium]|nr:methylenetetrahydrofolate--tRNA-(uracil(54)-C(5))-methyltransferase (FADH(2)-oxidizing) TrmFO [Candidatus Zymogenaceae bacterium]